MLVSLVSWMDIGHADGDDLPVGLCCLVWGGRVTLGYHAESLPPRLYSRCMARQGQDNRMLYKASQFLLPSLAPLYSNTPGELGHQVAHSVLTTPDTLPTVRLAVWCSGNTLVSINAVALHRARLVLGWVTAFGHVNCLIT